MAQNRESKSILDSLGEEMVRIITPVSICMFMVVVLVSVLNTNSLSSSSSSLISVANIAYEESDSDSPWNKFLGALLNSLVFVAAITVMTFVLVFLFYLGCTRFLKIYMGFSAFAVLLIMGGQTMLLLVEGFSIPIDALTCFLFLFNFAVVGVLAVFMSNMAIFITQSYLVVIGMLVAFWFTLLPEWTTWVLLVAMALYDLAAVLLPVGPLRLLVELAISRDEDIPALVYEARPVIRQESDSSALLTQRRVWRDRRDAGTSENPGSRSNANTNIVMGGGFGCETDSSLAVAEEGRVGSSEDNTELSTPLIHRLRERPTLEHGNAVPRDDNFMEGIGLASSGAIKLGLGDFIFYSVLVGRAAMYDLMTVYACYLAIMAGLGVTLMLLTFYRKALPALPVSITLGVLFYFLSRFLLEDFVTGCSMKLVMF